MSNNNVKGIECRFAIHVPSNHPDIPDVHLIKEQIHYNDGTIKPNLRIIKNFERSFWITKDNKRNHEQKKEAELLDNLLEIRTTQSNMRNQMAKVLNRQWSNDHIKQLMTSPYIYGAEISSTAIIKKMYMNKYPDLISAFTIAYFDIETDVVNGTKDILMASLVFQNKIFISVTKDFVSGFSCLEELLQTKIKKYIGEYITKYNIDVKLHVADNSVDVVKYIFSKAHELRPDFLAIWNMDFDIPQVLKTLEDNKIDPKDVLCDPSVPKAFRICKYKQGIKKKVTSSGLVKPINPAAQWHTLICTSSFYVIDAMCAYKHIRLTKQEESSYSLDNILNKELGIRKLKFEEADSYTGIRWHQFMQTNYKLEYIVYNIFDSLSMMELDNKTKDLAYTLPAFSGISDFSNFKSQPKRIIDALHYFFLENKYVIGTVGYSNKKDEVDIEDNPEEEEELTETLGLKGWIVTLPAHLTVQGMNCIKEDATIRTNIRCFVYDVDSVSAYPMCISTANVSKATTRKELIDIAGVNKDTFKLQNLNILLGNSNAIEYSVNMFNFPKPYEILKLF